MQRGDPVAGNAHVGADDGVLGKGLREGVEEGGLGGELALEPLAGGRADPGQVGPWRVLAVELCDEPLGGDAGVAGDNRVGRVVLRRIVGVDVDRDERPGAGHAPVLGHHAV